PLYVRAGVALAANLRSPPVWADPWRVNDLIRAGRQGWLVAPATGTVATARSQGTTLAAVEPSAGDVAITLKRAAREQQLLVLTSARVCRVLVDGAAVSRAASAATL